MFVLAALLDGLAPNLDGELTVMDNLAILQADPTTSTLPLPTMAASLEAIARLMPAHASHLRGSHGHWTVGGGFITAWGLTGIDDERSRLHERFEIGVHSTGTYHSIDTGKYTTGPYLAEQACDRIAPRRRNA